LQALQGGELFGDAGGEGGRGGVFDVAQEVFHTDFLGFFGFDGGGDVQEGFAGLGAVLDSLKWDGEERKGSKESAASLGEEKRMRRTSLISSTAK
jgi:hypothetical protein